MLNKSYGELPEEGREEMKPSTCDFVVDMATGRRRITAAQALCGAVAAQESPKIAALLPVSDLTAILPHGTGLFPQASSPSCVFSSCERL